jgi:Trypsin-like peptidase domain/Tetratricopeptide repeat
MDAQYCGRCGESRRRGEDRFCPSCGAPYRDNPVHAEHTRATDGAAHAPRAGWWRIAALAASCLVLGALAARFALGHYAPLVAPPAPAPALPALVKQVRPAVVTIEVYDAHGRDLGFGSGFFIARDGRVITNHHVLAGAMRAAIRTADGAVHPVAFVLADDHKADLAELLAFFDHPTPYLEVSERPPLVGDRVIVVGSPLGFDETVSEGIVSALPEDRRADVKDLGPATLQVTAAISEGSSGGPVVDGRGRVIGVADTTFLDAQALNFAVPARAIAELKSYVPRAIVNWRKRKWTPTPPEWYQAGFAQWYVGDCSHAYEYFGNALDGAPAMAEAWWGRGVCAYELGVDDAAIGDLTKAIALNPDYARAHYDLARIAAELGRTADADREREMLTRLDPALAEQLARQMRADTTRARTHR